MRIALAVFIVLVRCTAVAQVKHVEGKIVYIVPGSIYTSLGRNDGVADSMKMTVLRSGDTVAVLKVFAVSAKSSVCSIVDTTREPKIGDRVTADVPMPRPAEQERRSAIDTTALARPFSASGTPSVRLPGAPAPLIRIGGQIGLQYFSTVSPNSALDMTQPGMLVSLRGESMNIPLKFDLYGILRSTGRGGSGPLSGSAQNDSRVYRMTLTYDDRSTVVSLGRILPVSLSSAGYLDGMSAARRLGGVTVGAAAGFQPDYQLQFPSTDIKKMFVFAQYESTGAWNSRAAAAYTVSWSSAGFERELISGMCNAYSLDGFSVFVSSDVDLRAFSNGKSVRNPSLTLLIANASYRFSDYITVGAGVDAARPVYDRSLTKLIPDTLLERNLKSGVSLNANVLIVRGIGISSNYTSRFNNGGRSEGSSGTASLYAYNLVESGASLRMNYLSNDNIVAHTRGYGFNLQRNLFGLDCGIRYQRNRSGILQIPTANLSTTTGFDVAAMISRSWTIVGSYDLLRESDVRWNSLFAQLTWRF